MNELENLLQTLANEGFTIELKRANGEWRCSLRCTDSRMYSVPNGRAQTIVEAINDACDHRLELLLQGGN